MFSRRGEGAGKGHRTKYYHFYEGLGSRSNYLFIQQIFIKFLLCAREERRKWTKKDRMTTNTGGVKKIPLKWSHSHQNRKWSQWLNVRVEVRLRPADAQNKSEIIIGGALQPRSKSKEERKLRLSRVEQCQDENRKRARVKKIKEFWDQNDLTFS